MHMDTRKGQVTAGMWAYVHTMLLCRAELRCSCAVARMASLSFLRNLVAAHRWGCQLLDVLCFCF
jgi:hypothetical protein